MTGPGTAQQPWRRRPLSLVTFGNSVATLQVPMRDERGHGTYTEVLADLLAADGIPVAPHLEAEWFDFLHRGMRDYQRRVRNHCPDVVVVQYGLNESQPWLVPVSLVRHLIVQHQAVTRTARNYREHVADRVWTQVRGVRRVLSGPVGTRTWQTTPDRFTGHLHRLVRNVRLETRALVLVLDVNPPGELLEHFLPGMHERHALVQQRIEATVAGFDDPDVRLVRSSAVCDEMDPRQALPDGMHLSPAAHRWLGERLAQEVRPWVAANRLADGLLPPPPPPPLRVR
jgi:lysophospholipase L1-like esterase